MVNITLKQLRAFVAVARTQSFTEACVQVHLSQPALSIAIKNLEEEVGGALFSRTTRAMALTPEGEEFYPVAQKMLHEWDAALDDLQQRFALNRGRVVLATMPSFASSLLPKIIGDYRNLYPNVSVTINDVIAEDVVDMVRNGVVEVGITFDPGRSEDLAFTPLFDDRFVAVIHPQHQLATRESIPWQALLKDDFIALQRPSSIRLLIENKLRQLGMQVAPEFETHQLATIGRMVATGLGVSAVPSLCIQQMRELGAECRELVTPIMSRPVGIVTRKRYPLSTAAKSLVDIIESSAESLSDQISL
ncbi:LysR family transcriptional regulator [Amphritea balenae]|uniref:LysR family transcriptional regulator n=1 Tax=Amphritea balenae TaxID=452629 RepID=A0A3P1SL42_9GAMM|nr:LysR family transcriptional regulator [Amphritea balenae]RRC97710.1 LysR family transcriptional regulator [Amphritea balenae]GGK82370.1 transcriptional regulator [Amphritea balenae]